METLQGERIVCPAVPAIFGFAAFSWVGGGHYRAQEVAGAHGVATPLTNHRAHMCGELCRRRGLQCHCYTRSQSCWAHPLLRSPGVAVPPCWAWSPVHPRSCEAAKSAVWGASAASKTPPNSAREPPPTIAMEGACPPTPHSSRLWLQAQPPKFRHVGPAWRRSGRRAAMSAGWGRLAGRPRPAIVEKLPFIPQQCWPEAAPKS